jgi:hypothetical protein
VVAQQVVHRTPPELLEHLQHAVQLLLRVSCRIVCVVSCVSCVSCVVSWGMRRAHTACDPRTRVLCLAKPSMMSPRLITNEMAFSSSSFIPFHV